MRHLLLFSFLLIGFVSCVDRDFDAPPLEERVDPEISEDQIITIAELKALRDSEEFTAIQLDRYISAVIVADDQSGNFFRSLVLQDETGGITILLDDVELWNRYFVGTRIFVNLERIWLGEFAGLPQIGFEPFIDDSNRLSMARIPSAEISNVVLLGSFVGAPQGKVTTIAELTDADINTLVTINNAEFSSGSAGAPYADSAGSRAVNHTLSECNGGSIIVRSSGFADFADALTPTGGGSITAIYGVFNSDKQLLIRDLNDVIMNDNRCDGSGGGGGTTVEIDPDKVISISSVLDQWVPGEETTLGTDEFIKGVVVSSDETGNIFKTLTIQDGDSGIAILIDAFDIHINYTIGTEVYVHLQDLFVADFSGLPQLGYAPSAENVKRIPEGLVSSIVLKSGESELTSPNTVSISSLSDNLLNTLIEIDEVQFIDSDTGRTFADAANTSAYNATLEDCDGNQMTLRTSGFADYANDRIPAENGSIKGILQVFDGSYQLALNFPENIDFSAQRCDGTNGGTTVEIDPDKVVSISSVLDQWVPGEETTLGTDEFIKGVVVSSDETGNIFKTLTIQDRDSGIAILIDAFDIHINYTIGTEVFVHLQDLFVADFSGLPQLGYAPSPENVKRIPEGLVSSIVLKSGESELTSANTVSISSLSDNLLNTLIEIDEVQFIDSDTGRTFADAANTSAYNATLEDCDGNQMTLRTSGFADYANDRIPAENGSIKGILQVFDGSYQLALNFPENIDFSDQRCDGTGGGGGNDDEVFQTNFEDQTDFDNIDLTGWLNIAAQGDRVWIQRSFSGNGFAEATAFQDGNPNTESWLISPEINTGEKSTMEFVSAMAFYRHDGLEVLYSTDFDGSNAGDATWNTVNATLAGSSNEDYEWIPSGSIDLAQYGSTIYIAFKYTGTSGGNTTTFRIDDLSIN